MIMQLLAISTNVSKHRDLLAVIIFFVIAIYILASGIGISVIMIKYRTLYLKKESEGDFTIDLGKRFLTGIASLLYYVGSNLDTVMQNFGISLGCGTDCQNNINDISTVLLVMSLVAFTMLPSLSDKAKALRDTVYTPKEDEWSWSFWKNTEHAISMIIEVDGWFSTVTDLTSNSSSYCPSLELAIARVLYGVIIVVWIGFVVITYGPGFVLISKRKSHKKKTYIGLILVCIILCIFPSLYLFANNDQPSGCLFGCDVSSDTQDRVCYNTAYRVTRASLLFLMFIVLLLLVSGMIVNGLHNLAMSQWKQKSSETKQQKTIK